MPENHKKVWDDCLKIIKSKISEQKFKTWFEPIVPLQHKANTLTIQVPNQFFYEWLEKNYIVVLDEVTRAVLGTKGQLEYSIKKKTRQPAVPQTTNGKRNLSKKKPQNLLIPLEPSYTFENFIEGDSNQLTKSAAIAIAQNSGKTSFNPFMIYGDVGLGKSHIGQAIIHFASKKFPDKIAIYISSEKFTDQYINAARNNMLQDFIKHYEKVNLLVMDDVQFLAGKEKTQETFFNIFNHLHQSGKQIIMTSDRRPSELVGLQKRLLSRFKWGLTTELLLPSYETRMAIVQSKLDQHSIDINNELKKYIAANIETNIRDIEGVITSVVAHASLSNNPIDMALIKDLIENIITIADQELSLEYLQKTIATYYKLSVDDLKSKSRKREIVVARQVAMHLTREYNTGYSLKFIGQQFGKDHSTVIHALKCIKTMKATDYGFKADLRKLKKIISRRVILAQ